MIKFNKPTIEKKDLESVLYCMIKDDLMPGSYTKNFSGMLSNLLKIKNVAVFNTYFNSFEIIFHLLNVSQGDDVIIPSFARLNILNAVKRCKLNAVFVDLENDSLLPSFRDIEKKINKNTKCIIIPQMFGIPNDLSSYSGFGIPVVEDLDGAIGSKIDDKPIGSFGNFATMNFNDYSIITTGSGGMIASGDSRLRSAIRTFQNDALYIDYIMSDFNASLGISQLNKLNKNIDIRKKIGKIYDDAVMNSQSTLLGRDDGKEIVFSSYIVKTSMPFEEVYNLFKKYGLPVRKAIKKPLHHVFNLSSKEFQNTEEMFNELIALPIYPRLSKKNIENVARGIRTIL